MTELVERESKVLRNALELLDQPSDLARQRRGGILDAVVQVILDQLLLGIADGLLDRVQLLGELHARAIVLEHLDHPRQMAVGALESRGNLGKRMHVGTLR